MSVNAADIFRLVGDIQDDLRPRQYPDQAPDPACPHCHGHRVEPGRPCPTCQRRVPHPRKPTSPVTKPFAVRIPVDDHETFVGIVDAASLAEARRKKVG